MGEDQPPTHAEVAMEAFTRNGAIQVPVMQPPEATLGNDQAQ